MFYEGLRAMLRARRGIVVPARRSGSHGWIHRLPLKMRFKRSKIYLSVIPVVVIGIVIGFLGAIMGIGGGFILVPVMIYLLRVPTSTVIGTSMVLTFITMVFATVLHAVTNHLVNAVLALILNALILLATLSYFGAVLTLPGIAGVILTVGMAVDSNVLIFERIREEVRHGKTPSASVEQGFHAAWRTIFDTHVTTIVSAVILFLFGTGPVRGFAVTLSVGLLANLFTAVFVSRLIFDWILSRKERGEALSI